MKNCYLFLILFLIGTTVQPQTIVFADPDSSKACWTAIATTAVAASTPLQLHVRDFNADYMIVFEKKTAAKPPQEPLL